ncbi:GNAT family N-acetyltransferase [Nocardioides sp. C4-1]|uniref:GNAT family N-acetyltransferase n=1 Tax=Nocardioides sp. C4-1 TaxID=3151851 RepID=UPI003263AF67
MSHRDHGDTLTGVAEPPFGRDLDLDAAVQAADAAALASGVTVREVHDLAGVAEVGALLARVWGRDANPPINPELLRAFGKAGNYVTGAFDGPDGDRLVGACVAFFHAPAEGALHSHIAGTAPEVAGRHVGLALKLHQRAWSMLRGVDRIVWTFDPLVSRNAYFNITKLAARPVQYLTDFYGPMRDAINGTDDTDRLLLRWDLRDPLVASAATTGSASPAPTGPEPVVGLAVGPDGGPVPGSLEGETVSVAVPLDVAALRAADPSLAARWRHAVREALTTLLDDGGRVVGFDRTGHYLVRRSA